MGVEPTVDSTYEERQPVHRLRLFCVGGVRRALGALRPHDLHMIITTWRTVVPTVSAMVVKVRGWFTPLWVALAGALLIGLLLVVPISFLKPGDHEMTDCGNLLAFDMRNYDREFVGERDYREDFIYSCLIGRTDRLSQAVGVLALTGVVVTIALTAPWRRRATVSVNDPRRTY